MNSLMRRRLYSVFFTAALCLFTYLLLAATPVTAQTETTGAFEGRLTNIRTNQPIPGAVIQFINQDTQVPSASRTDAEGRFTRYQLQPGTYTIRVNVPGYQTIRKSAGRFHHPNRSGEAAAHRA